MMQITRKVIRRLAIILLVCTCGLNIVNVEAASGVLEYPSQAISSIMREQEALYLGCEEFAREAAERNLTFDELLKEKAIITYQMRNIVLPVQEGNESGISLCDVGNYGQSFSARVPVIQQTLSYNCGPTSILQILYGLNCQNNVSGTTDTEKIARLTTDCETAKGTGTYVYKLVNTINDYSTTMKYRYVKGSTLTLDEFQGKIETSLVYNSGPILHAITKDLTYYHGQEYRHYIAVGAFDRTTNQVTLKDCNYNDEYCGSFNEDIETVLKTIKDYSDRYLIYLSY